MVTAMNDVDDEPRESASAIGNNRKYTTQY